MLCLELKDKTDFVDCVLEEEHDKSSGLGVGCGGAAPSVNPLSQEEDDRQDADSEASVSSSWLELDWREDESVVQYEPLDSGETSFKGVPSLFE